LFLESFAPWQSTCVLEDVFEFIEEEVERVMREVGKSPIG
jgi:hypothetical protein